MQNIMSTRINGLLYVTLTLFGKGIFVKNCKIDLY